MIRSQHAKRYEITAGVLATSKIFQRGKTTVPSEVRDKLELEDGDKLVWVQEGGKIYVESAIRVLLRP